MSIFEPKTKEEVLVWHSEEQHRKFAEGKELLSQYERGCKKLIASLENAVKPENFIEFLAEFNVARLLRLKGFDFDYEKSGYEDFLLENSGIEISVKSLMRKKYQPEEEAVVVRLREDALRNNAKRSETIEYKYSNVMLTVAPTSQPDGTVTIERLETNNGVPGTVLSSEMQQKSAIIGHIKKFDAKASDKKKVMLFVVQNGDCPQCIFHETFHYYFEGTTVEADQTPYEEFFGPDLKRDIAGFVFIYRPNELLAWNENACDDTHTNFDGSVSLRFNVYAPEAARNEIESIFLNPQATA